MGFIQDYLSGAGFGKMLATHLCVYVIVAGNSGRGEESQDAPPPDETHAIHVCMYGLSVVRFFLLCPSLAEPLTTTTSSHPLLAL